MEQPSHSLEKIGLCPICASREGHTLFSARDHLVSRETFHLVRCAECGLIYTSPRPTEAAAGQYYQAESYVSHTDSAKGLINTLYRVARRFTLKSKIRILQKAHPGARQILDFGCGTGDFLAAAKHAGFEVTGLEPEEKARRVAAEKHGITTFPPTKSSQLAGQSFDIITLWHVLEHIHELHPTMNELTRLLKPGGVLIVAVPNAESADAKWYKAGWAAWDVPRHLYHFSPESIQRLFAMHQLDLKKTRPMFLDGFYIAMLSEKYRNKPFGFLRAVIIGKMTFIQALFKHNAASSLIYILRKK